MVVCVKCGRQMRPKKNGVAFVETAKLAGATAEVSPYKLWMGDLLECQDCGTEVIYTMPTQTPIAHNYQPDFAQKVESYSPICKARDWTRGG